MDLILLDSYRRFKELNKVYVDDIDGNEESIDVDDILRQVEENEKKMIEELRERYGSNLLFFNSESVFRLYWDM